MDDLLFVTLARGGSKGVPGKHLRLLGGEPVIDWTIYAVKDSKYYNNNYVVSSDDRGILDRARYHGVIPLQRPAGMARDDSPSLPALMHAVRVMEDGQNKKYNYVIEVMATSPFKTSDDIDEAIEMLIESGVDSVIGVTEIQDHHPMRAKWLDVNGYIQDFLREPESGRRQDCVPTAYIRNGTIYALKTPIVRRMGHERSIGLVMPPERSINIDTEMDWIVCQAMVK